MMKFKFVLIIAVLALILMADGALANKFVFTEGASQTLNVGVVSTKITVERQTDGGIPITSSALNNIVLSRSSTGGRFYSNAAGTILINHTDIANGASNASFYYRDTKGGTPTLRASLTGWSPANTTFTINPNQFVFTAGENQTLNPGQVSSLITVQRQTSDGIPITSPALYYVLLSSSSTSGKFYSNAAGTTQIYRINIGNGASTGSFYYKDTAAGNPTIKASLTGWTPASTQFTINQNKLVFTVGETQTLNSGEVSSIITVQRQTSDGTPIISPSLYNVILSSTSAGGKFYSNAAGTTQIYRINIANGASTASFFYKDIAAGTPTLKASLTGWTPADTMFTIGRNKLVFMAGTPQILDAGEISFPITVQRQASDSTPITSSTLYNIILSTSSGGGKFYSNAAGTIMINHVDIANGASTASFYYKDTVVGNPVLTVSRTGWTSDTAPAFTINPAAAKKLKFSTQPVTTTAGLPITPAVKVEVQDAYGNRVTSSTASISIVMGLNPGPGVLTGGGPVNAVDGVATFDSLSINKDGLGYSIKALSTGLTGANSRLFNIIPVYTHSITNTSGEPVISIGGIAQDTVTSTSTSGTSMTFKWIRPDSSTKRTATKPRNINYIDMSGVDQEGTWTIQVTEKKAGTIVIGENSTTFSVVPAPEFGRLGAVFPLLAIGFIYMSLRKKLDKK